MSLALRQLVVAATMRNLEPRGGSAQDQRLGSSFAIDIDALDVDDDASVREAFATIAARHGPIDVLVNNAGVPGGGAIRETLVKSFREVMETRLLRGAALFIKEVIPGMRQRGRGTIVNVTSIIVACNGKPMASYAASKWALEALSEFLAQLMRAYNSPRFDGGEPGVIATPDILGEGQPPPPDSPYPHGRRLMALFAARLANPTPPSVVGDLIRDIVNGDAGSCAMRRVPNAWPMLKTRAMKSDEQVVEEAGASDEAFLARIKRDLGLDLKL